jgi:hypothetical protein
VLSSDVEFSIVESGNRRGQQVGATFEGDEHPKPVLKT